MRDSNRRCIPACEKETDKVHGSPILQKLGTAGKAIKDLDITYHALHDLIEASVLLNEATYPTIKIRQTDLLKNSAINGDDCKTDKCLPIKQEI